MICACFQKLFTNITKWASTLSLFAGNSYPKQYSLLSRHCCIWLEVLLQATSRKATDSKKTFTLRQTWPTVIFNRSSMKHQSIIRWADGLQINRGHATRAASKTPRETAGCETASLIKDTWGTTGTAEKRSSCISCFILHTSVILGKFNRFNSNTAHSSLLSIDSKGASKTVNPSEIFV